jgi:hypothetical protein
MNNSPFDFIYSTQRPTAAKDQRDADFDQFEATELYCPECKAAVPVRKFLLLVLPEGEKYEYRCQHCGTTVGDKLDKGGDFYKILKR